MRRGTLRILFIAADVDLSQPDGQGVHVGSLARAFGELGEDVLILVSRTSQIVDSQPRVAVQAIPNIGFPAFTAALRQAQSFRPDLIYERRFSPKLGAAISAASRVPYYMEINGLPETEQTASVNARMQRTHNPPKIMYRMARRIFVPSQRLAQLLAERLKLPPTRFVIVPNGADLDLFRPIEKIEARRVLGLSLESPLVVYVGKLAPWQGLETLVDAGKYLTHIPGLQVLIIGDGPVRESIAKRIMSREVDATIRLTGALPHNKIPMVLAAADLCVAPFSRVRNDMIGISPIKLFEYMAAAKPTVASEVAGVREIIQDAGVLVPPDSPEKLAAALESLLCNPAEIWRMGALARVIAEKHSWRSRAEQTLEVIASCLTARG